MDKYWGHRNKKHKKTAFCRCQCFAPAVSAVACLISSWGLNQPHHTPKAALLRGRWHRQKDKNPRLRRKTKPGRDVIIRKHWKTIKIVNEVKILWRLVAVGNGWLWLTPCKRMKLRRSEWAQLGDSTQEGMSLVEGRLWSKLLMLPRPTVSDARHYIRTCLQAALASELAWS